MKWKAKVPKDKYKWYTIFAFVPHKTSSDQWVWLEKVNRRVCYISEYYNVVWEYQERQKGDAK